MSAHNHATGHLLAVSLSDLNTWCYACDSYVMTLEIENAYQELHLAKFGNLPGQNLAIETRMDVDGRTHEEREETGEEVREKVRRVADMIRESKRCVVFTGAGISTSAKIPDFRGPTGVWTLKAKGIQAASIKLESAIPTFCHMTIVALIDYFRKSGRDFYVISQNIDGLHRRSGIPADTLSELHGNSFKEICWKCEKDYLRTFDTAVESGAGGIGTCDECLARVNKFCHCTRRKCICGAVLKDSIIHFGENLPQGDLKKATEQSKAADLHIILGSSLTVSPANEMPKYTRENGGKVCLVNLQSTQYDSRADIRIFAKTDEFCKLLMEELGIPVPEFDVTSFFMDPKV